MPGEKTGGLMFFPFRFLDESPQVFLINWWEGTRCTGRRTAVERFVERQTSLVEAVVLRFHRVEEEMMWTIAMKKRASECECSNARCIRGKAWRLLLAFVAFVHSLDDGFGQIERGIGKKYVVSLF